MTYDKMSQILTSSLYFGKAADSLDLCWRVSDLCDVAGSRARPHGSKKPCTM